MAYTEPTLKRLFALSGNVCAFPLCTNPIVDTPYGVVVGEICHIAGRKKGSARYNENQSPDERDSFENLTLMCSMHHTIIDAEKTSGQFPVELLQQYKREHEANYQNAVVNEAALQEFVAQVIKIEGSIIVTVGQSGGQVAHRITNIIAHDATRKAAPALVPEVESHMVKADNGIGVDFYDFRVRLRNDGS